jgi:hypothetical protein
VREEPAYNPAVSKQASEMTSPAHGPCCCSVARRLGLIAAPLQASGASYSQQQQSPLGEEPDMPSEVAARLAGRATLAAPAPDLWLVACSPGPLPPPSSAALGPDTMFVDVGKRGRLLDWKQLGEEMPAAAREVTVGFSHAHPLNVHASSHLTQHHALTAGRGMDAQRFEAAACCALCFPGQGRHGGPPAAGRV